MKIEAQKGWRWPFHNICLIVKGGKKKKCDYIDACARSWWWLFCVMKEILQELKESKRRKSSSLRSEGTNEKSESKRSSSVQLNITEFYRSTKVQIQVNPGEDQGAGTLEEKRKVSSPNLSKSVRRRLLFD
jgi:hypothetical protein